MARSCIVLVALALFISLVRGDKPAQYDTVPQAAPDQVAKQRKEKQAFLKRTTYDMYDKVGEKDPRWDDDARKALEFMGRFWANESGWDREMGWRHAEKAIKAGCTDPFIRYVYIRMAPLGTPDGMTKEESVKYYEDVAAKMLKSKYPPYRIAMASVKARLVAHHPGNRTQEENVKLLKCMALGLQTLQGIIKDQDPYAQANALDLCYELIAMYKMMSGSREYMYRETMNILEKDPGCKKMALLLKGHFLIDYAWDARGNGPASTVTEQGWKDMQDRLKDAAAALEEAWKLPPNGQNPLDARIAVKRMAVELGKGKSREFMELWFQRAMQADSDNLSACLTKMNYLEPKWHGSPDEMIAFGRACFKTDNWEGRLPLMRVNAHLRLAKDLDAEKKKQYYQNPAVRDEIKTVLDISISWSRWGIMRQPASR